MRIKHVVTYSLVLLIGGLWGASVLLASHTPLHAQQLAQQAELQRRAQMAAQLALEQQRRAAEQAKRELAAAQQRQREAQQRQQAEAQRQAAQQAEAKRQAQQSAQQRQREREEQLRAQVQREQQQAEAKRQAQQLAQQRQREREEQLRAQVQREQAAAQQAQQRAIEQAHKATADALAPLPLNPWAKQKEAERRIAENEAAYQNLIKTRQDLQLAQQAVQRQKTLKEQQPVVQQQTLDKQQQTQQAAAAAQQRQSALRTPTPMPQPKLVTPATTTTVPRQSPPAVTPASTVGPGQGNVYNVPDGKGGFYSGPAGGAPGTKANPYSLVNGTWQTGGGTSTPALTPTPMPQLTTPVPSVPSVIGPNGNLMTEASAANFMPSPQELARGIKPTGQFSGKIESGEMIQLPNGAIVPKDSPAGRGLVQVPLGNGQVVSVDKTGNFSDAQGNPITHAQVAASKMVTSPVVVATPAPRPNPPAVATPIYDKSGKVVTTIYGATPITSPMQAGYDPAFGYSLTKPSAAPFSVPSSLGQPGPAVGPTPEGIKKFEDLLKKAQGLEQQIQGKSPMEIPPSVFDKNRQLQKDFNSLVDRDVLGAGKQPTTPLTIPKPLLGSVKEQDKAAGKTLIGQLTPSTLSSLTPPMDMNTAGTTPSLLPSAKDLDRATIQKIEKKGTANANLINGGTGHSLQNGARLEVSKDQQSAKYAPGDTTKVTARLSDAAYSAKADTKVVKTKLPDGKYSYADSSPVTLPDGSSATVIKSFKDDGTGFQATAYRLENGQVVVAYAGTNDLIGKDGKADLSIVFGQHAQKQKLNQEQDEKLSTLNLQVKQARQFYNDTVNDHGAVSAVTGHSLGGALAQVVGAEKDVTTETFNAPGMATYIQELQELDKGNPEGYKSKGTDKTINHTRQGDIVGHTGQHSGNVIEYQHYEPSTMGAKVGDVKKNHNIGEFATDLNKGVPGEVRGERSQSGGGTSTPTYSSTPTATGNTSSVSVSKGQASSNAQGVATTRAPASPDEIAQMQGRIEKMQGILSSENPPSPESTSTVFSRNVPGGNLEAAQRAWEVANNAKEVAKGHLAKAEDALRAGDIQVAKQEYDRAAKLGALSAQTGSAAAQANVAGINVQSKVVREVSKAAISGAASAVPGPAGKVAETIGTIGMDYVADRIEGGSKDANKNLPGNVISTGVGALAGVGAEKIGGAVVDRMIGSQSLFTKAGGKTLKEIGSGPVGKVTPFGIEKVSEFGTKSLLESKGTGNAPREILR